MTRSTWDDTAIELVRRLLAEGVYASQIVLELNQIGYLFTRNAVIGKAHRLRLPTVTVPFQQRVRKPRQRRSPTASAKQPVRVPFIRLELPPPAPEDATRAFGKPVGLLELKPHHCRWIINDPADGAMFCAAGKLAHASYCAGHCAVAYRRHDAPAAQRRAA